MRENDGELTTKILVFRKCTIRTLKSLIRGNCPTFRLKEGGVWLH
jgi:hypothetical protein